MEKHLDYIRIKSPAAFWARIPTEHILTGHSAFDSCRCHVQTQPVNQWLHVAALWGYDPCREINDSRGKSTSLKTESDKSSGGNQVMGLEGSSMSKRGGIFWGGFTETVVETLQNVLQHETKTEHRSTLLLFIFLHIFSSVSPKRLTEFQSVGTWCRAVVAPHCESPVFV